MKNKILSNLASGFCIYLLTVLNVIHAIQTNTFDWILWASVGLSSLSAVLAVVSGMKGGKCDA